MKEERAQSETSDALSKGSILQYNNQYDIHKQCTPHSSLIELIDYYLNRLKYHMQHLLDGRKLHYGFIILGLKVITGIKINQLNTFYKICSDLLGTYFSSKAF